MNNAVVKSPVIIGGGPAGSAAAIHLANAGIAVRLLERTRTAHHKVCGEFISWEAAQNLATLGLDLPDLGAQPVRRARLYNGRDTCSAALPHTAWSLSRKRLDAALLAEAEGAGVEVWRGAPVKKAESTAKGWHLTTVNKQIEGIMTDAVFLASGKHDVRPWQRPRQGHELVGLKMHFRLDDSQREKLHESVEVHLFNGGYAGLELVEEGVANLCFLVDKDVYNSCGRRWREVIAWLCRRSPHLGQRLQGASPCWPQPLAVYGTPYGYLHHSDQATPGLFRLGDQTAVIPSFAGDGISIALHSATLAARVYQAGGTTRQYHQLVCADARRPVRNARVLEQLLSKPQGRAAAFWTAQRWPKLLHAAISGVRLPAEC